MFVTMEQVANGVWLLRGGFPGKTMNVYLLEDDRGVTIFDAGISAMSKRIAKEAAAFGGVRRVVLGHSHPDHRGAAASLARDGARVYCHADEVADAEGDGGVHYFDLGELEFPPARFYMAKFLKTWDGGPVQIHETLAEGDSIAGFEVVHLPGHAPGMIALWRESDRVALTTDAFYLLDPQTGIKGKTRVPHRAFNADTSLAAASIRKLADLDPLIACPGHVGPLVDDVAAKLRQAADDLDAS
jgi:glyoxylase-like metal-dependent hydrolase (beta-lactamase superfamily II)